MANFLLDALSGLGTALDTPGSIVRGLLAGDPSSALEGVLDPSRRVSGRGLLDKWGITNNDSGALGDIGGFAAQVATDPLTWFGGALAKTILGRGGKAAEAVGAAEPTAARTLLESAPGVGGYKKLADGTIIRTEPLAAEASSGINSLGERTFAGGSKPLTEAEQWRGVSPYNTEANVLDSPELANGLMDKRRNFTMVKDWNSEGARFVGGKYGPPLKGFADADRLEEVGQGVKQLAKFRSEGMSKGFRYGGAYDAPSMTGAIYPEAPEAVRNLVQRHEVMHGLINEAAGTGDTSGLGFIAKLAAKSRGSDNPTIKALSSILEETAANAVGSARGTGGRGALQQLQGITSFLSNPHEWYYNNAMRTSPLAAEIYGSSAVPRVALGLGGAGAAGLLSALGAGSNQ